MTHNEMNEYFMERTDTQLSEIKAEMRVEFKEIRAEVRQLLNFRYLLLGASIGISSLVSLAFNLLSLWGHK